MRMRSSTSAGTSSIVKLTRASSANRGHGRPPDALYEIDVGGHHLGGNVLKGDGRGDEHPVVLVGPDVDMGPLAGVLRLVPGVVVVAPQQPPILAAEVEGVPGCAEV